MNQGMFSSSTQSKTSSSLALPMRWPTPEVKRFLNANLRFPSMMMAMC